MYGKRSFQTHDKVYEELTSQNPIHLGWVGMINTPATPFSRLQSQSARIVAIARVNSSKE